MKRAVKQVVVRSRPGRWLVVAVEGNYLIVGDPHPTHAEALAHALHEVGLTPTNPEPVEAP